MNKNTSLLALIENASISIYRRSNIFCLFRHIAGLDLVIENWYCRSNKVVSIFSLRRIASHTHCIVAIIYTHETFTHLRRTLVDANAKFQLIARSLKIIFTLIDGALFFACEHLFEIICTCHTHKSLRHGLLTDIDDFSHLIN